MNYFIRSIGSFRNGDSELMSHENAMETLEKIHEEILEDHDNGSWFDADVFDVENECFEIEAEEKYQISYIIPENTKSGLEYYLEEIRRESERADMYAKCYEYELSDNGVFDCTERIRHLVAKCSDMRVLQKNYIGQCKNRQTGEYVTKFVTEISPALAYSRARENAMNGVIYGRGQDFDLSDIRVLRQDLTSVKSEPKALDSEEQRLLDSINAKHVLWKGEGGFWTKEQAAAALLHGATLDNLFQFQDGQDCTIYKSDIFWTSDRDVIIYIPDLDLNEIRTDRVLTEEEIEEVIDSCYSRKDFMEIVGGDKDKAIELFHFCDWQHPSTAWDEGTLDDEEE